MSFLRSTRRIPSDSTSEDGDEIDENLRLRTVRTAHSAIAESIRSERRQSRAWLYGGKYRKPVGSRFFSRTKKGTKEELPPEKKEKDVPAAATADKGTRSQRRNIYFNRPLPQREQDRHGEPLARFARNKVRTTKYTILTFVPKNLYLQFLRVANLFFLSLIILQLIPIFGAPNGQISMVPLVFILTVTAIKDGLEDYRRSVQDDIVNNSAATKMSTTAGGFTNPNIPHDPRPFWQKMLGLGNKPGSPSRGVRRLRQKEAGQAMISLASLSGESPSSVDLISGANASNAELGYKSGAGVLEDIQSVDSHGGGGGHVYPPSLATSSNAALGMESMSTVDMSMSTKVDSTKRRTGPPPTWERTLWKKLEVGDIVLLREDDQVPADILVLSCSDPTGQCFLETKNLDGETNLKMRRACKATSGVVRSEESVGDVSFTVDSEGPSAALYEYRAILRISDESGNPTDITETVGINELLLRGCSLRNTAWVIGLVVFTGRDTKIMMNGGLTPSKRSRIEVETNFNVLVNFGVLVFMCAFSAVMSGVWDWRDATGTGSSKSLFEQDVDPSSSIVANAFITFASCFVAFQNIVPISLYISIEIVKTIQAYFISQDVDLYYESLDAPCVPKTWNISDDLGQIEYIFSDKTGTLTQNVMELQRVSINGIAYGEGVTEAMKGKLLREGSADGGDPTEQLLQRKESMIRTLERSFKNRYMQNDKLTLISPPLADTIATASSAPDDEALPNGATELEQKQAVMAFFRALALCHGVLAAQDDVEDEKGGKKDVHYKAESPDEAALVSAARDIGFPFLGKKGKDSLEIQVLGSHEIYTLLRVIEFDSTRKRMSVIVRCPDGRIELFCKGADSVIYERIRGSGQDQIRERTRADMERFANEGLRTLCISHRIIGEDEFRDWEREYEAVLATTGTSEEVRESAIDACTSKMERELVILGATALEDKLQEGVPESIEQLHQAGIKLWILTGDKLQTAIEIGYSCNLLKQSMDVMILSAASPEQARNQVEAGLNKIASVLGPPKFEDKAKRGFVPGKEKASFAVVIDGDTLRYALDPKGGIRPLFLNLGTQCETVVCCRVSPAQKAQVVKLVKDGRNAMTLSIGDGANDVAMIQEANIGCGLLGLEGSQAAMSADYAFGQFRFLTKLLLVHGHWSYQRVAEMHSNFFYKNVIWTLAMFWYLPFNSFDSTYIYQYTFILLYNVVFTSLPVITLGAFDQDINVAAALAFPQLYLRGIRGLEYTRAKFWLYMFDGVYQSAVVFFIPYLVWSIGLPNSWNGGRGIDSLADFGTTVAVAAIFAANLYIGMNTNYWTIITWIVVWGSSIVMLGWIAIYSFLFSIDFIDEVAVLFGNVVFWATVLLTVVICLGPRFIIKFIRSAYFPLDKEIVREMWVMGDLKERLGLHRRNKKRTRQVTNPTMESAPMFNPHARSASENSEHDGYEPATVMSASAAPANQGYLGSPPISNHQEIGHAQYPSYTPEAPQSAGYLSPPSGLPSASPRKERFSGDPRQRAVSPNPSYYSASDLPPPSPQPQPTYRYPSGEITTTPPSRRTSVSRSAATARGSAYQPVSPTSPANNPYLQPSLSPHPESIEMRPTSSSGHGHAERSASAASAATFMTANDDFYTAENEPVHPTYQSPYTQAYSQSHPSESQPRQGYDDDDRSTLHGRESAIWESGRAV